MSSASSSWSDLLPDLLGLHAAARQQHVRQLPWIVFPDGSFGQHGDDDDGYYSPPEIIPADLPDNVTCLGAAAVGWLALDCTDDEFRRTHLRDKFDGSRFLEPRPDVKHRHSYRLYNPFTGETVLLPELDSLIGEVAETFDIRKILMRRSSSDSPDDQLVAVITNSYNYNIIIFRPGKGSYCVIPNIDVFDVAFHRGKLYGVTPEEELVVLNLVEDDEGAPIMTKCTCRRVIKKPLADGEEDHRSWMYDDEDDDDNSNYSDDNGGDGDSDDETSSQNIFNGDGLVPSSDDMKIVEDENSMPYDIAITTRRLVQSSCGDGDDGELLMVRHHKESSPRLGTYTLDVDILKADIEEGKWVPSSLAEGEALFLSRSFSKCIRAYGEVKEGFVYYTDADDIFDTKSRDCSLIRFPIRWEGADHKLLTWLFPPELQP